MGVFNRISRWFGFGQSLDAAKTTNDNRRHWTNADAAAAVTELTPAVRDVLRRRARYECRNNCYARGLISTLAGDTVGTGPRLQVLTSDNALNQFIETEWNAWCEAVNLTDKLRILDETRRRDGECFALFRRNQNAESLGLPSLDLRLIEADQVSHPYGAWSYLSNPMGDDGVVCDDKTGDVVAYKVLRVHPGDMRSMKDRWQADDVPAADVIHWFRAERPGQLRGYPELTPALPLFAYLRRYMLAVIAAAETGANIAAVLETDLPMGNPEAVEPYESIPIERNMMMTVPSGARLKQLDNKIPSQAHADLVDLILREIGRATDTPFGIVAGDSSKYNYSSARMDHQTYELRQNGDRKRFRVTVLDRIFARWLEEARLMYPALFAADESILPLKRLPAHAWHFDARPSIDPVKDADSDATNLANGTDTRTAIAARDGRDLEDLVREQAREREIYARHGVPYPEAAAKPAPKGPDGQTDQTQARSRKELARAA
jgi:lambda family phage portal protein